MAEALEVHRFDSDAQVRRQADGDWAADVRPGWNSLGGSVNGGYLMALAVGAAAGELGDAEPVTATAHFIRPGTVGPAQIAVETVKRGRVKSTVAARLTQDGGERLRLLATLADPGAISGPVGFSVTPPAIPAPDECLPPPPMIRAAAEIAERFDYRITPETRWIRGTLGDTARLDGWIRFADGREPDIAALPLLVDAFPPAVLEVVQMAATPTLELTVHVRQRPAPGWIQARLTTRALVNGLLEEDVELWDATGALVAMSRQLALFQPLG
jgi:acyl-CoA thioesterase